MILLILQHSFFCGGGGVHTIFSRVHFHAASAERGRDFVGRIDESMEAS
jgi:hypothetical protein